MALPRFVVLYSPSIGKYVRQRDSEFAALGVTAAKVSNPHAKFEVEPSEVHSSMVHIRCSYNNKFLRRYASDSNNVLAASDEPDDSLTDWASTLFQPEDDGGVVRLLHVQLGRYAQSVPEAGAVDGYVAATGTDPLDPAVQFRAIDWESLVTLPKYLTFKGDNGSYLGLVEGTNGVPLRFKIDDPGDSTIAHEVVAQPDGTSFRIMNVSRGGYWRLNAGEGNKIWSDASPTTPDVTVFGAIKVNDDTIALRSMGNNMLCKRYSESPGDNYFTAGESEITNFSKLSLAERVTSRRIKGITFKLDHGWVYNKTNVQLTHGQNLFNETDETQTVKFEIGYKDVRSCTWEATNTTLKNLGPVVQIHPDGIPSVKSGSEIEMIPPYAPYYRWGETTLEDPSRVVVVEATLQPWTRVIVSLSAYVATCHVPFTYTRYDVLNETSGTQEAHFMEDGVYTCTNYFGVMIMWSNPLPIS